MNRRPKAKPAWRGRASQKTRASNCLDHSTKAPSKQGVPIPGTCLCAYLKRYRADLLNCEESRELSTTVDCVDFLLSLVGVQP